MKRIAKRNFSDYTTWVIILINRIFILSYGHSSFHQPNTLHDCLSRWLKMSLKNLIRSRPFRSHKSRLAISWYFMVPFKMESLARWTFMACLGQQFDFHLGPGSFSSGLSKIAEVWPLFKNYPFFKRFYKMDKFVNFKHRFVNLSV